MFKSLVNFTKKARFTYSFSNVSVDLCPFETYKMDTNILPKNITVSSEELVQLYRDMQTMRRMELACDDLYKAQQIRGFCHLYDGQEAIIAGIEAACNREDPIITGYRVHCHAYTRGFTPRQIIAEMMGKRTGATGGKGGSMHYYNRETNFYGGHGIVGAQCSMGAGLAFALKYLKKPNVSITMYGDGVANQGQLFEAANMAQIWKLPCLFICENNKYAMGTSVERHSQNPRFYERGDQIPGIKMDGNNYFHVKAGMEFAKKWSIENGPLYIEIQGYRYHGHSMSDPGLSYRSREEVQEHRKTNDCIDKIKKVLIDQSILDASEIKKIDKEVKKFIESEVEQAKNDPFPDNADLLKDVYIDDENHFIRGINFEDSKWPVNQQ